MAEFEMTVVEVEEHEDGSATVVFDFSKETLGFIVQHGLLNILKKAAEEKL